MQEQKSTNPQEKQTYKDTTKKAHRQEQPGLTNLVAVHCACELDYKKMLDLLVMQLTAVSGRATRTVRQAYNGPKGLYKPIRTTSLFFLNAAEGGWVKVGCSSSASELKRSSHRYIRV